MIRRLTGMWSATTNAKIRFYHISRNSGKTITCRLQLQLSNTSLSLSRCSFKAKDLTFMPVSGITGQGIKDTIDNSTCPWYDGPAFIPFIDDLPSLNRKTDGPFIMPIVDKYKDMGTVVMGKVESGTAKKGQNLLVMPNRVSLKTSSTGIRGVQFKFSFRHKFRSISFGLMKKKSRPSVLVKT